MASATAASDARDTRLPAFAGLAFLFGIFLHSLRPYAVVPMEWLAIGMAFGVGLVWVLRSRSRGFFVLGVMLVSCLIGVWRFDVARANLPSGLRAFDPNGFARTVPHAYEPSDPRARLARWRGELTERIQRVLPGDEGALISGMLYGERGLSAQAKERFRSAGLLHLVAVSGSNVALLASVAMAVLLSLGMHRRSAFALFTALLITFVLFVQPQASVVRAAIMGWLVEFAPIVGRIPKTSRLLLIAAVAFVAWQPWALLFDAGFALSFLATIGLMTWGRRWSDALESVVPWEALREGLCATAAATLMTAPYAAWAFGQFSLVGLIANALVVPAVPWIMATSPFVFFGSAGSFWHMPAKGFASYVLGVSEFVSRAPVGIWSQVAVSPAFMFACYASTALLWIYFQRKNAVIPSKDGLWNRFLSGF